MSLSTEDKQILIKLHFEKAHMCLTDGEQLETLGSISAATNRFYYAVFHTIHALFVANGLYTKSHHGMSSLFHQHFILTGTIDPKFGRFVAVMENMREKADYDVVYTASKEELEALKPLAYELLSKAEELLS